MYPIMLAVCAWDTISNIDKVIFITRKTRESAGLIAESRSTNEYGSSNFLSLLSCTLDPDISFLLVLRGILPP